MNYICDIILNLNKIPINIFEWENNDNIKYFKKIPIIKVSTLTLQNFTYNDVKIEENSILKYKYKNELYDKKSYEYAFILTDLKQTIAIIINNNIISKSYLQLEDEDEVFSIAEKEEIKQIKYKTLKRKYKYSDLTRKEIKMKSELLKEFNKMYKNKDINKLKYYYYEYFNKEMNDVDKMYSLLISSLNIFNNKHILLYKIINKSINNK